MLAMLTLTISTERREAYLIKGLLTFPQGLLQQVMLGLQFNDEVAAVQVLLEFLRTQIKASMS